MKDKTPYQTLELFRLIATGDEQAYRSLFDQYRNRIHHYITNVTHDDIPVEELIQDIFLRIWANRHLLSNVSNPDSYLFIMTRNRILNYVQAEARERKMKGEWSRRQPDGDNSTEKEIDLQESRALIDTAISLLPPQQAKVFLLSKEQGLTRGEIAGQLHLSENTVKNHLLIATNFIKKYLREHGDLAILLFIWHYQG